MTDDAVEEYILLCRKITIMLGMTAVQWGAACLSEVLIAAHETKLPKESLFKMIENEWIIRANAQY